MIIFMRILVITDEVWNDTLYPSNVLTNWFDGLQPTQTNLANIYLAAGVPDNLCCKHYYQITDKMMIKSLFTKSRAGRSFTLSGENDAQENIQASYNTSPQADEKILSIVKNKFPLEFLRLIKDCIWLKGRYDEKGLRDFINDFCPEVIFSLRYASLKVLSFERLLLSFTDAPMFVFTGDDEYTLAQLSLSPFYWIRRIMIHKSLNKMTALYHKYYTLSERQTELYQKKFHIPAGVLRKCGSFHSFRPKSVHTPITLVYAGRLYCGRYKTLLAIKKALDLINRNHIHMVLHIYSRDNLSKNYIRLLTDNKQSFLYPPVSPGELKQIYQKADIALHVESFDLKNCLITKYSFSTKIVDCLASSCAVLAICPKSHAGFDYLKNQDGAICVSSIKEIKSVLLKICKKKSILKEYQKKAFLCGMRNHQKENVQNHLLEDMQKAINLSFGKGRKL